MQRQFPHSKRFCSRLPALGDVYVCWGSAGYDDTSPVRDLSSGGLFVQTRKLKPIGAKASIHFLVEEGQIRAEAVVRHIRPGTGLGLEFTAIFGEDRQRLSELMRRLRAFGFVSRLRTSNHNQQAPSQ